MKSYSNIAMAVTTIIVSAMATYWILITLTFDFNYEMTYPTEYSLTLRQNSQYSIADLSISNNELVALVSNIDFEQIQANQPVYDTIGSIQIKSLEGEMVNTDEVFINVEPLIELYFQEYEDYDWDTKDKIAVISTLWEFLVNQQGMHPINAAAILGSVAMEGDFSEQQGTGNYINNIEDARSLLGRGGYGYGVAQWTFRTRQKNLLEYYEMAYELYPDDWNKVQLIAECCMLIEEVKVYNVFGDIDSELSMEDACGRVCIYYERYSGCDEQWSYTNGHVVLVSDEGSGKTRLRYAQDIYNHFMQNI